MTRKKLVIAIPTDERVDPYLFEWTIKALQTCPKLGFNVQLMLTVGKPVCHTRNKIARDFLNGTDADYLLSIDSDQVPYLDTEKRTDGLHLLLEDIQRDDVDVVHAVTVRNTAKGPVPICQKVVSGHETTIYGEILEPPGACKEITNTGVMGGAGFLVKRHVIQKFWDADILPFKDVFAEKKGTRFDKDTGEDLWGNRIIGHDIWFCLQCHELGARSWVDTRVFWGHRKMVDMKDDFMREMAHVVEKSELKKKLQLASQELALLKNGATK